MAGKQLPPCPQCRVGRVRVKNTRQVEGGTVRYCQCDSCGKRIKTMVPQIIFGLDARPVISATEGTLTGSL